MWVLPNFYCEELYSRKLELKTDFTYSFFFLTNRCSDEAYIRALAASLIPQGCHDFHFCGTFEPMWHLIFDDVDIEVNPENDQAESDVALTLGYDTLTEFARELESQIRYCDPSRHKICFIYDDHEAASDVYQAVQAFRKEDDLPELSSVVFWHHWQETWCTKCQAGFVSDIYDSWTYHIENRKEEFFIAKCPKCRTEFYVVKNGNPHEGIEAANIAISRITTSRIKI